MRQSLHSVMLTGIESVGAALRVTVDILYDMAENQITQCVIYTNVVCPL